MSENRNFTYRADDYDYLEAELKYEKSDIDEMVIEDLLSRTPTIIEGSRGSGKTMLMKVAGARLLKEFKEEKILPVYVSFKSSILINDKFFLNWMLSKTLLAIREQVVEVKHLIHIEKNNFLASMFGIEETHREESVIMNKIQSFIDTLETSWTDEPQYCNPIFDLQDNSGYKKIKPINEVDYFINLVDTICSEFDIERIIIFFDEACHNFLPIQQRIFFNMFRNLRVPKMTCKVAVYPGITSYGDVFQIKHDAQLRKISRTLDNNNYIAFMRNILKKSIKDADFKKLEERGELLNYIIYAASGNPRTLLKSVYKVTNDFMGKLSTKEVNQFIKDFYRVEIWTEHLDLKEKYTSHSSLIEWGKDFVEQKVLVDLKNANETSEKKSLIFAVDMEKSKSVEYAIKILEYSGIILKLESGLKKFMSGKNRMFEKYQLNLGILLAQEVSPTALAKEMIEKLSEEALKYYTSFPNLVVDVDSIMHNNETAYSILSNILNRPIEKLDISEFLISKMKGIGIHTIGEILRASRNDIQKANGIAEKRTDRIVNSALSATLEYISG